MPRFTHCIYLEPYLCSGWEAAKLCDAKTAGMQVLQKRLRSLNDDLKRDVVAELDGLAAQVSPLPQHMLS